MLGLLFLVALVTGQTIDLTNYNAAIQTCVTNFQNNPVVTRQDCLALNSGLAAGLTTTEDQAAAAVAQFCLHPCFKAFKAAVIELSTCNANALQILIDDNPTLFSAASSMSAIASNVGNLFAGIFDAFCSVNEQGDFCIVDFTNSVTTLFTISGDSSCADLTSRSCCAGTLLRSFGAISSTASACNLPPPCPILGETVNYFQGTVVLNGLNAFAVNNLIKFHTRATISAHFGVSSSLITIGDCAATSLTSVSCDYFIRGEDDAATAVAVNAVQASPTAVLSCTACAIVGVTASPDTQLVALQLEAVEGGAASIVPSAFLVLLAAFVTHILALH